jgi:hypothetical protein
LINGFVPEDHERNAEIRRVIEQHFGALAPQEA